MRKEMKAARVGQESGAGLQGQMVNDSGHEVASTVGLILSGERGGKACYVLHALCRGKSCVQTIHVSKTDELLAMSLVFAVVS